MILELIKLGNFNKVDIDQQMLSELVETFPGRVPVIGGHDVREFGFDDAFALGKINAVASMGSVVGGEIDLNKIGQDYWDQGLYFNWSLGVRRNLIDGVKKWVIDHLALLGAIPPGIPNLEVIEFSKNTENKEIKQFTYITLGHKRERTMLKEKKQEQKIVNVAPGVSAEEFAAQKAELEKHKAEMAELRAEREKERLEFAKRERESAINVVKKSAEKLFSKESIEDLEKNLSDNIDPKDLRAFATLLETNVKAQLPIGKPEFNFNAEPQKISTFGGMYGGTK